MGLWAKLCTPVFNRLHMIGMGVIVFILVTTFARVKVYRWAVADRRVLLEASYASPLPRVVIAPRQLPPVPATYRGRYEFGTIDAFSWNVPLWQKIMAPYS